MPLPDPPAWLPRDPDPPGRSPLVEECCQHLARPGPPVCLVAAPGMGATTVAGAVARRLSEHLPVRALRLAGAIDSHHAFHMMGWALDAPFPGDQAAVAETLAELGPSLLILDDADGVEVRTIIERLAAVAPEARYLVVGRRAPLDGTELRLGPLPDAVLATLYEGDPAALSGNPLLAILAQTMGFEPQQLDRFLDSLPTEVEVLATCPAGVPGPAPDLIPRCLLLPSDPGHCLMRRAIAEAIWGRRRPAPATVALALRGRCQYLLDLGHGAPLRARPDPRDIPALSLLAEHHPDPDVAASANATIARLRTAAGQTGLARVWSNLAEETPAAQGSLGQALLAWAEGDACLVEGELQEALVAWEISATQFRKIRALHLLANLHRRCGELLVGRAEWQAAEEHLVDAHALYRQLGDPQGEALCKRNLAEAALGTGQMETAEKHLENASALGTLEGEPARALRLGTASLALAKGDLDAAEQELNALPMDDDTPIQTRACIERRRADLAIARGDTEDARRLLQRAEAHFAAAGDRAAQATTTRRLADLAAMEGHPAEADRLYAKALQAHVRAADLGGLARTLEHRVALEQTLGDKRAAREISRLLERLLASLEP